MHSETDFISLCSLCPGKLVFNSDERKISFNPTECCRFSSVKLKITELILL